MILHRVTDDVGDLDEAPVVLLVQRPENAPLHRLQAVGEIRNRAVADDVAGVIEKPAIHARVQADFELLRIKRLVGDGLDRLGDDVIARRCRSRQSWPACFARTRACAPSMGNSGWSDSFFRLAELMSGAH